MKEQIKLQAKQFTKSHCFFIFELYQFFLNIIFSRICKGRSHSRSIAQNSRGLRSLGLISVPHMFYCRHETKQFSLKKKTSLTFIEINIQLCSH